MVCPLTVICALASHLFRYVFLHRVNAIISSFELSKAISFPSSYSAALILALASCLHSCSTESAFTCHPQSSTNDVAIHSFTSFYTSLNTPLRYMGKSMSDTGDLCRTTVSTAASSHWCSLMINLILLLDMKVSVYRIRSPSAFIPSIVCSRSLQLTWSNTPLMSISRMSVSLPSAQAFYTFLTTRAITSMTLLCFQELIRPS